MTLAISGAVPVHRAGFEEEEHHLKLQERLKKLESKPDDQLSDEDLSPEARSLKPLDALLFTAIEERDVVSVQLLLRSKANPEQPSSVNVTAVHFAVEIGFVEGLKLLCKERADVNKAPAGCSSPFWTALMDSDWDILHVLIRARADTNGFNEEGVSPLIHVTSHSEAIDDFYSMQILNILLKGRADPNLPDHEGFTALQYAVKYGHEQMTCLLIKNQADVNFANNKYDEQNRHAGKTALSFAAEQADTDMTATLLNYGADVEAGMAPQSTFWILQNLGGPKYEQVKQMIMTMMAQSRMGFNRWVFPVSGRRDLPVSHDTEALERDLLRTASMPGSDATGRLKSLLDVVDLGCKDFRGRCALWKASFSGDIDKVEWLVRAKADLDQTDLTGSTAIQVAAQQGHNQVVQFLSEKHANPNRTDESEVSPLYSASQFGHEDVVRYLVNHGAQLNQATKAGATPLFIATQEGQATTVQVLLNARADVFLALPCGSLPLYIAVRNNHPEIVEMLLKASMQVDKAIKDPSDGVEKPPLVIAAACGHADVVRVLKRSRGDVDKAAGSLDVAMEVAKKAGHEDVVRVLQGSEPLGGSDMATRAPRQPDVAVPATRDQEANLEDDNTAGCGRPICRHYIRNECNRRNCRYCHGPHCRFCREQDMPTHADRADFYFRGHNRG